MDIYITVGGAFEASAFGCSLEYLVRRPTPVRVATAVSHEGDQLLVPKELWLLIDRLQRDGLDDPALFQQSGDDGDRSSHQRPRH